MKGKRRYFTQMRRRLSKCRKRLDTLKKQGYHFSNDIYYDIESIEKKIVKTTIPNKLIFNKSTATITVVCLLIISAAIFYWLNDGLMKIDVDEIKNSDNIKESFNITGNATHTNGVVKYVEVRINDESWNYAKGNSNWSYFINISQRPNGNYTIYVRCNDGNKYSSVGELSIRINKTKEIMKQIVTINYPSKGDNVKGIVTIQGDAAKENGEIQYVQIRFDKNGPWENISGIVQTSPGKINWKYNWPTTNIKKGEHFIEVRSNDGDSYSDVTSINVSVQQNTIIIPPWPEGQYFQLYFPPSDYIIPNHNYEINGIHRERFLLSAPRSFLPVKTRISINNIPDWLEMTVPSDTIITYPINISSNITIVISITDDAPMNTIYPITIDYEYGLGDPAKYPNIANKLNTDTWIYTGQW